MFDTVRGLPVHILVIHLVVVGVPVLALATVLVAVIRRWRPAVWPVVVADALLVALVWVAQRSGQALLQHVGGSELVGRHEQRGDRMIWFAATLLAAAVLVALTRTAPAPVRAAGSVLTVVAAVAAVLWVIRTGEAGADAVWRPLVRGG